MPQHVFCLSSFYEWAPKSVPNREEISCASCMHSHTASLPPRLCPLAIAHHNLGFPFAPVWTIATCETGGMQGYFGHETSDVVVLRQARGGVCVFPLAVCLVVADCSLWVGVYMLLASERKRGLSSNVAKHDDTYSSQSNLFSCCYFCLFPPGVQTDNLGLHFQPFLVWLIHSVVMQGGEKSTQIFFFYFYWTTSYYLNYFVMLSNSNAFEVSFFLYGN